MHPYAPDSAVHVQSTRSHERKDKNIQRESRQPGASSAVALKSKLIVHSAFQEATTQHARMQSAKAWRHRSEEKPSLHVLSSSLTSQGTGEAHLSQDSVQRAAPGLGLKTI